MRILVSDFTNLKVILRISLIKFATALVDGSSCKRRCCCTADVSIVSTQYNICASCCWLCHVEVVGGKSRLDIFLSAREIIFHFIQINQSFFLSSLVQKLLSRSEDA